MSRLHNTFGGGAQTNINGLSFEEIASLKKIFENAGYTVYDQIIYHPNFPSHTPIGMLTQKHNFYKNFLEPNGIYYQNIISKQLLPDEVFINYTNNTIYIIEKKFQTGSGSVDEKITTCDFKKKQFQKLMPHGYRAEYYYILNDWFNQPMYRDHLSYIINTQCKYFFNTIPLNELGL